jgi:fermentation-respiration switch protein FrsA (DUF1100 family)
MSEIECLLVQRGLGPQERALARLRELPLPAALTFLTGVLQQERASYAWRWRLIRRVSVGLLAVAVALLATQHFVAFGAALGPGLFLMLFSANSLRASVRWCNARTAARETLSRCDDPALCGSLLELAATLERLPAGWPGASARNELEARLTYLLPRLDPDDARQLSPAQRAQLRRMLERLRHHPDTLVAILLALGTAHDSRAIIEARLLVVNHPSDRVRAAARECLISLGSQSK